MPMFPRWMYTAVVLIAHPAIAQSPWNGTWKLNKSTVHAVPSALSIVVAGLHYTLKQGPTFRIRMRRQQLSWA
jgi:hypothetical protein